MPKLFVVGNWKMNTTVAEAVELASSIAQGTKAAEINNTEVVICPPFISIVPVSEAVKGSGLVVGAQDVFYENNGAFTGEITSSMLVDFCHYVIVGHSERRTVLNEGSDVVNLKLASAISFGLYPILCVGETLAQRRNGEVETVIREQVTAGLSGVTKIDGLLIAYEPLWAIGTGHSASPSDVVNITTGVIPLTLSKLYGETNASGIPVLYGGSVNPNNVDSFIADAGVAGTLLGGASLIADDFVAVASVTSAIASE